MKGKNICQYLSQAILLEVLTSPKPGLVTRLENGAHRDMSIFTFAMSSPILSHAFYTFYDLALNFQESTDNLLPVIRMVGKDFEEKLLASTKGVNTQKGILFAGGLLAAAAGCLDAEKVEVTPEALCETVMQLTKGIVERELCNLEHKERLTAGETLYLMSNFTGIRGEAEKGFPSALNVGLPALEYAFARGSNINDALVHALLALMTVVEDSNIVWRQNLAQLQKIHSMASEALEEGSLFSFGGRLALNRLCDYCLAMNISPGGTADMLSLSLALYLIKHETLPGMIM